MSDTPVAEVQQIKTKRAGNPLMRSCTDADLTNNQEFVFQKLDSVFKGVEDDTLLTAILWKKYLEWRKDEPRREKVAKAAKLRTQIEALGLSAEEVAEMLKSA